MATDTHTATELGFAPDDDVPIPYMQRTRDYYLALGYNTRIKLSHNIGQILSRHLLSAVASEFA
jgi:hypothetical protein